MWGREERGENKGGLDGKGEKREGYSQHHLTRERLSSDSRCWRRDWLRDAVGAKHRGVPSCCREETGLRVRQHRRQVSLEDDGVHCVRSSWKIEKKNEGGAQVKTMWTDQREMRDTRSRSWDRLPFSSVFQLVRSDRFIFSHSEIVNFLSMSFCLPLPFALVRPGSG